MKSNPFSFRMFFDCDNLTEEKKSKTEINKERKWKQRNQPPITKEKTNNFEMRFEKQGENARTKEKIRILEKIISFNEERKK